MEEGVGRAVHRRHEAEPLVRIEPFHAGPNLEPLLGSLGLSPSETVVGHLYRPL